MEPVPFPGRKHHLKLNGDALPFHPLASIFPLMEGDELRALKDDIAAHGLREPIVLLDGLILDGRNRYLACHGAVPLDTSSVQRCEFVDPPVKYIAYTGNDPLAFVLSMNLKRRHLNESQRAMVAANLAALPQGRPSLKASREAFSDAEAARALNVGEASVERAKVVKRHASSELVEAVEQGRIPVSVAAKLARESAAVQRQAVNEPASAAHLVKHSTREARERVLARHQAALPERRFGVIYADPEWRFEPWSRETGMDRAADNHYPTSTTETIAARDVTSIAAEDCVLFLWATVPMLREALVVMRAWDFAYKTHIVWAKPRQGTGYWFRNAHELLLVGTRGDVPAPAPGTQWGSLVEAPLGQHSHKPEIFLELIEQYFPNLPKVELNRRGPVRPGWEAWGNEAGEAASERE